MQFIKVIFVLIISIILIQSCFAQPDKTLPILPISANNLQDFVPSGWKIGDKLEGDLDSDGIAETILVLKGANQELIKDSSFLDYNLSIKDEKTGELKWLADNNPVIIAVLSKEKNGYKLMAQNNRIIPLFEDNWYRWNHSVTLENKTLKVELSGKVSSGISDNFGETKRVYKFQTQNSELVLTEAEETFWFQAMLARNGRKDRYEKYDFLKNKGFVNSTISIDRQPAKEESHKINNLIPFEKVAADFISKIESFQTQSSINTQSDLVGKYYHDTKIDEGQHSFRLLFELKNKNVAVYSNEQDGAETQRRFGTWTWNKKTNQITIILPPIKKNPIQGQEIKLTFVFKIIEDKLKLIKDLPYKDGQGEIYQRM